MRGLQIRISLPLLLDLIGLEAGKIQLGMAMVDTEYPDTLLLILRGEDACLPEVSVDARYPRGTVVCTRTPGKIGIQGKIMIEGE